MSANVPTGTVQWWWLRHAPSDSPANIIHGTDDVPADLSAHAAIRRVAGQLPESATVLVSGIRRVSDTYAALSAVNSALTEPEIELDFREQDFGNWTGRTWDDVLPEAKHFWSDPIHQAPTGGESYADMCRRVLRRIETRTLQTKQGTIVAVAHAGTIRAALALALNLDFAESIRFEIDPLSITRIDAIAGATGLSWRVNAVNIGALEPAAS